MNQIINHTEKQIEPVNPVNVAATIKGIAPRSFEKTFSGLSSEQVAYGFKICLDGLTRAQIEQGMIQVRDNGFCPDPAMFRKWCLGIKGFASDADPVKDSYKGKYAAIANIEAWLSDSSIAITNAEREAYNRVYGMFQKLEWADNYERTKFYAYEAFKDSYVDVVKALIEKGEKQSTWDSALAIETKKNAVVSFGIDYLNSTPDIHVYRVSQDGFESTSISIKKTDIQNYMKENNLNNFDKAKQKLISLEIKKINWIAK